MSNDNPWAPRTPESHLARTYPTGAPAQRSREPRSSTLRDAAAVLAVLVAASPASATPQFARAVDRSCTACHVLPPKLNDAGRAFVANGYRWIEPATDPSQVPGEATVDGVTPTDTVPFAAWLTTRYEDRGGGGPSDVFLPKVELISGGAIGASLSYFAEWRVVSLSLNGDGSLLDRGGRFEDLLLRWDASDRHSLRLGQFRSLNQVDVSLRLSASEPLLFRGNLATERSPDPRLDSLYRFSPSNRSPAVEYAFRSRSGPGAADGLFHMLAVPFAGELSIPLSDEASEAASFELAGPKGVYAETFFRRGERSLGAHAFYHDDAWLVTALGTWRAGDLFLTAGVGLDDGAAAERRTRSSLEGEYLLLERDRLRAMAGLRLEEVSNDGTRIAYIPYLALAGPNRRHTYLLQIEYLDREGADVLVVDLSAIF